MLLFMKDDSYTAILPRVIQNHSKIWNKSYMYLYIVFTGCSDDDDFLLFWFYNIDL